MPALHLALAQPIEVHAQQAGEQAQAGQDATVATRAQVGGDQFNQRVAEFAIGIECEAQRFRKTLAILATVGLAIHDQAIDAANR